MRLNRALPILELEPYCMATDKIILFNSQISNPPFSVKKKNQYDFFNYLDIYKFFLKPKQPNTVHIFDITHNTNHPNNSIFFVNDHINKIGTNPFIGHQDFFNIDFINVENLYTQSPSGVITTCYGERYNKNKTNTEFPSTYLANVAALAHINQLKIKAHLINQI